MAESKSFLAEIKAGDWVWVKRTFGEGFPALVSKITPTRIVTTNANGYLRHFSRVDGRERGVSDRYLVAELKRIATAGEAVTFQAELEKQKAEIRLSPLEVK